MRPLKILKAVHPKTPTLGTSDWFLVVHGLLTYHFFGLIFVSLRSGYAREGVHYPSKYLDMKITFVVVSISLLLHEHESALVPHSISFSYFLKKKKTRSTADD